MAMMPSIKGRYQAGYPQAFLYGNVKPTAHTYKATCRARARSTCRQSGGVVCASSPSRYCGGDGTLDHQQMRGSSSLGAAAEPRVNPTAAVASQALAARSPLASMGSAMASAEIAAWASASAVAVGSWAVWLVVESGVVSVAQKLRGGAAKDGVKRMREDLPRSGRYGAVVNSHRELNAARDRLEDGLIAQAERLEDMQAQEKNMRTVLRSTKEVVQVNAQMSVLAKQNQVLAKKAAAKIRDLQSQLAASEANVRELKGELDHKQPRGGEFHKVALPPSLMNDNVRLEQARARVKKRMLARLEAQSHQHPGMLTK